MSTYILVSFIFSLIAISAGMIMLLVIPEWPHKRSDMGMGEVVVRILLSSGFALWAAWLLWGGR